MTTAMAASKTVLIAQRRSTRLRKRVLRYIQCDFDQDRVVCVRTTTAKRKQDTIQQQASSSSSCKKDINIKNSETNIADDDQDDIVEARHHVDLPESIFRNHHQDPLLIQSIVRNYKHTASYWPTRDDDEKNNDTLITDPTRLLPSIEICLNAHSYYMANIDRTKNLHLLVLCESHAVTPNVGNVSCLGGATNLPFGYLNLVHCLPYGETWLLSGGNMDTLTPAERNGMNKGTLPFWQLLSVMAGLQDVRDDGTDPLDQDDCFDFLKAKTSKEDRLEAKKGIFKLLQHRGISLMDVSLFPMYAGGWKEIHYNQQTKKPYYTNMSVLKKARLTDLHLRTCWKYYTEAMIHHLCPTHLLVLSKTIDRTIGAKTIQATMDRHGGHYCGARVHPSTNLTTTARMAELRETRNIVTRALLQASSSKPIIANLSVGT